MKSYLLRIEQFRKDLKTKWQNGEKVGTLQIAISVLIS